MSIQKIFDHFDQKTRLWISVQEVQNKITEQGCPDDIEFHFVTLDEAKVRGFLVRTGSSASPYATPYDSDFKSDIYIANSLDEPWQRVVAVKELLHIVDTEDFSAESHEAVNSLLTNMALPSEVREHRPSYVNDRLRLISAISILVPKECRTSLRELHAGGSLTPSEISLMARIPERFVPMLMSDDFEEVFKVIHAMDGE